LAVRRLSYDERALRNLGENRWRPVVKNASADSFSPGSAGSGSPVPPRRGWSFADLCSADLVEIRFEWTQFRLRGCVFVRKRVHLQLQGMGLDGTFETTSGSHLRREKTLSRRP
jgi:hypothetical protein